MTSKAESWDALAIAIHKDNTDAGWWDDPNECVMQKLQMASTEVAEATEGARKNLMDTHLTNRPMEEVEYSDVLIRILDLGGRLGLKFYESARAHKWCLITNTVGKQHMGINAAIVSFGAAYEDTLLNHNEIYKMVLAMQYSDVIESVVKVITNRGFDLIEPIEEKRKYNAQRLDHKRETRQQTNGKKF
jgi:hypothetical protein